MLRLFLLLSLCLTCVATTDGTGDAQHITITEVRVLLPYWTTCVRYMEPFLKHDENHVSDLVYTVHEDTERNRSFNMTRSACTLDTIQCFRQPFDPLAYSITDIFTSVKVENKISNMTYTKHFNGDLKHSTYTYFHLSLYPFSCDDRKCTHCEESCESVYFALGRYSCQGEPRKRHIHGYRLSHLNVQGRKERALFNYGRVTVKNVIDIPNANVTCAQLTYKLQKFPTTEGSALTSRTLWNPSLCQISTWENSYDEHESIVCHDHGTTTRNFSMELSFFDDTTSHRISDFSRTEYSIGQNLPFADMDVCGLYSGKCLRGCYQTCHDLVSNPERLFCNGMPHIMDRDMITFNESFPVNFRYKGAVHIDNRKLVCLSFDSVLPSSEETTKFWTRARLLRPYAIKYVIECGAGGSETAFASSSHCLSSSSVPEMTVCAKVNCSDPVRIVSLQGPLKLKLFREKTKKRWSYVIFQATEDIVFPVELNTTMIHSPPIPCVEGCRQCRETCQYLLEGNGKYFCARETSSISSYANTSHIPGGNMSAPLSTEMDMKNYSSAGSLSHTNMSKKLSKNESVTNQSYHVSEESSNSTDFVVDPKTEITTQIPDDTEQYTFHDFFFPISKSNGCLLDMNCISVCLICNILYSKHIYYDIFDRLLP